MVDPPHPHDRPSHNGEAGHTLRRQHPRPRSPDADYDTADKNPPKANPHAAALDGRPVTQAYTWLTKQRDNTPSPRTRPARIQPQEIQQIGRAHV